MFKKYFVEEVIKQIEHPNNIKRWKAIENALNIEHSICANQNCSNLICYINHEEWYDITILYVTDKSRYVIDHLTPSFTNCDCNYIIYFCCDACCDACLNKYICDHRD